MAIFSGKTVFKLLLIITMVIQPVAVSYAMASMNHASQSAAASGKAGHEQCHMTNHELADTQHDSHGSTGNSDMGDCCHAAGCCPVAVLAIDSTLEISTPSFSAQFSTTWGNVILPSEVKPPRRFLS
jgi:hypothetical protein